MRGWLFDVRAHALWRSFLVCVFLPRQVFRRRVFLAKLSALPRVFLGVPFSLPPFLSFFWLFGRLFPFSLSLLPPPFSPLLLSFLKQLPHALSPPPFPFPLSLLLWLRSRQALSRPFCESVSLAFPQLQPSPHPKTRWWRFPFSVLFSSFHPLK